MRKLYRVRVPQFARALATVPWNSQLPQCGGGCWAGIGKAVVDQALSCDTGREAFQECCVAREQLESIVQSLGYDMNVYIFGGLVTLRLLEAGGDVDFVGVADVEPTFEEAGDIVSRTCREFRRLGLRASSLPKARVPLVKVDRVSKSLPGSPFHNLSCDGIFQFTRPVSFAEAESFEKRAKENYSALQVDWNSSHEFATVQFSSTSALVYALSRMKRHESVEIPLRLPVDARHGPELYRFPFDFCLSSTGLRNSHLLADALAEYPYSRHLLLVLKKWGRACGTVNSIDGLLATYALTIMVAHFLIRVGVINRIPLSRITTEANVVPMHPEYVPLAQHDGNLEEVGKLLALFFEYYGSVFDYKNSVVCTTNTLLTKEAMGWTRDRGGTNKPPFFEFAIKDPYGLDNIARNLDVEAATYVQNAHQTALGSLLKDINDPAFALNTLIRSPPRPVRRERTLSERGIHSDSLSSDQLEARHILKKVEFKERKKEIERLGRKTVANNHNQTVVTSVTKNVLGWIRTDETH